MDRKKIYIAIIVVCFAATAGILYYNFSPSSTPTPPVPQIVNQADTSSLSTTTAANSALVSTNKTGTVIYNAPVVFPQDTKYDWTLLQADKFKNQVLNPGVSLDPGDVGRDDPLKPY